MKELINILGESFFSLITKELLFFVFFAMLMYVAILLDLSAGVKRARVMNEKIYSGGFRQTFIKFSDYVKIYYFGLILDFSLIIIFERLIPVGISITALAVCIIELKSIIENMKISKAAGADILNEVKYLIANLNKKEVLKIIENIINLKKEEKNNNEKE